MAEGWVMVAPGANGSFPSSTADATKPKNIIALNNPHTRTTGFQGTRICMAEPPGTKSRSRLPVLYCETPQTLPRHLAKVSSLKSCKCEVHRPDLCEGHTSCSFVRDAPVDMLQTCLKSQ